MFEKKKGMVVLTALLCLAPMIAGMVLWSKLPDPMPTHFDVNNEPNGWSSKPFAVFGLPAIVAGLHLVCVFGTKADPEEANYMPMMEDFVLWICPVTSIVAGGMTYAKALGYSPDIGLIIILMISVLFILLGNFLPKVRQNYTFGIKLPWTYDDVDNWNATQRFGGKVFMGLGVLMLLTVWFRGLWVWILLPGMAAAVILPTLYSYLYYKRHR